MLRFLPDWWRGPDGLRAVFLLAWPLIVSNLSTPIVEMVDRILLFDYSDVAVAAVLPANWLGKSVICLALGMAIYVNAFVSQYHGADRPERIAIAVWQGIGIGLLSIPFMVMFYALAPLVFNSMGHPPHVAEQEISYFQIQLCGNSAWVMSAALSAFFTGRGKAGTVLTVEALGAALNIGLDFLWIYGRAGFPEGGIAGAAWALVTAHWFRTLIYLAIFLGPRCNATYRTRHACRYDSESFWRLVRFGGPNGLQLMLQIGGYAVLFLFLGRLGTLALAASSLVFPINALVVMPVYGLGVAATTLVGQRIGQRQPARAARVAWFAFGMGTAYMCMFSVLFLFAPDAALDMYWLSTSADVRPEVHQTSVTLLRFVAFYCLFDTMNVIFGAALKGAGDIHFVLYVTIVLGSLPLVIIGLGTSLGVLDLYGVWTVITSLVCSCGLAFLARFIHGKWRHMRVIEENDLDPARGDSKPVLSVSTEGS